MKDRILLITEQPEDLWCRLVVRVLAPSHYVERVGGLQALGLPDLQEFSLAILDSTSLKNVTALIVGLSQDQNRPPIVVATASPNWRQARDAFAAGAIDYCRKSYDEKDLPRTLTTHARQRRGQSDGQTDNSNRG